MGVDTSALGLLCARVMEQLATEYDADQIVRTVGVVVEVDCGDRLEFSWAVTDDRDWFAAAFFKEVTHAIENRIEARLDSEE